MRTHFGLIRKETATEQARL